MQNQPKPEENAQPHDLILRSRSRLSLTGVQRVLCCDETLAQLETTAGRLTVSGRGLEISELSVSSGQVELAGIIEALEYTQPGVRSGFLSRLGL